MFIAGAGSTRITLRSVWFLLLYASDLLSKLTAEEKEKLLSGEWDNDLLDALAEVLAVQVDARVRAMLARGYRTRADPLTRVRGRIDHLGLPGAANGNRAESSAATKSRPSTSRAIWYMLVTLRRAARRAVSSDVRRRCLATAQMLERKRGLAHGPHSGADVHGTVRSLRCNGQESSCS